MRERIEKLLKTLEAENSKAVIMAHKSQGAIEILTSLLEEPDETDDKKST